MSPESSNLVQPSGTKFMKRCVSHRIFTLFASLFLIAHSTPTARGQSRERELWTDTITLSHSCPAEAVSTNETATADQQQRRRGFGRFGVRIEGMYKAQITPHWFAHNTRFWYRSDLRGGGKEFILVDAERGNRQMAVDPHPPA